MFALATETVLYNLSACFCLTTHFPQTGIYFSITETGSFVIKIDI